MWSSCRPRLRLLHHPSSIRRRTKIRGSISPIRSSTFRTGTGILVYSEKNRGTFRSYYARLLTTFAEGSRLRRSTIPLPWREFLEFSGGRRRLFRLVRVRGNTSRCLSPASVSQGACHLRLSIGEVECSVFGVQFSDNRSSARRRSICWLRC